jgi:hypothetical protein
MTLISLSSIASVVTWYHVAAAAVGALGHKIWSKLVGAEKKLAAEVEKLAAEAKSKL